MAEKSDFQLRAFCHLDRIQPQFAAFVGSIAAGSPPVEGMSSLYVEMAPGNWVFRVVDSVLKAVDVKPGAQVVERQFGMFEVHSEAHQAWVPLTCRTIPSTCPSPGPGPWP